MTDDGSMRSTLPRTKAMRKIVGIKLWRGINHAHFLRQTIMIESVQSRKRACPLFDDIRDQCRPR